MPKGMSHEYPHGAVVKLPIITFIIALVRSAAFAAEQQCDQKLD